MGIQIRGKRGLRTAVGVVAAAVLFLIGGRLMLGALERQLIYFPSRVADDAPTPVLVGASRVEEVWVDTDDGVRIHGIYASRDEATADVLFFHGNAGNLYDRLDNVEMLVGSGFNVFIIDYRGYGKSEGAPSEEGLYADGLAALSYMTEKRGVALQRTLIFGRSLGSAVAIELGARFDVGAIVVESGFTSAQDLARVHYSWLPGVLRRSMTHRFESLSKASELRAPVLYVHGSADSIVPMRMGRELFDVSPEPKGWYEITGAGHNDTWFVGGRAYFDRLAGFAERHIAAGR